MAQPAIRCGIQIGEGEIQDTYDAFGFIYIESDHRTAAPEKDRETTSYAEEEGEHIDLRTVDAAFDYKVKFLLECPNNNIDNANEKIRKFNEIIRTTDFENHTKTCKRITLWNWYKRVKISGIPDVIAEATDFYRDRHGKVLDCVLFELKIRVDKPSDCNFSISVDPNPKQ